MKDKNQKKNNYKRKNEKVINAVWMRIYHIFQDKIVKKVIFLCYKIQIFKDFKVNLNNKQKIQKILTI